MKEVFTEKQVYLLLVITACASAWGVYTISVYKIFGVKWICDDYFLALIGSVSAIVNGVCRFIWGYASETYGFKSVILVLMAI
jgi:hypothetical protein